MHDLNRCAQLNFVCRLFPCVLDCRLMHSRDNLKFYALRLITVC